ncbi:hypothetical protein CVD28_01515 [Bacillus sp. M6-12]|uniref:hypothetical protein n=1 Tax=Bacillus sp. M6-12 TaxID=2054166 RepID=UPI000C780626|nr:hypothetical protein [Bacillus sp. M6-12]PLS19113.1 hypothetical protein CVD28_01515 [Bacillus sp. M6-12]
MAERETVFMITVFNKVEKNPSENKVEQYFDAYLFGNKETVGIFPDKERCEDILSKNIYNIHDNAGYEFAVIEEVNFNQIYPEKLSTELYQARHYDVELPILKEDGSIERFHKTWNVTYEKVDLSDNEPLREFLSKYRFSI